MATNITLYLPNNGERYRKRRKTSNNNQLYICPRYIALHDTKPENNVNCKVNEMNHYERSVILRRKFETMNREKTGSLQPMNKKQMFRNKRNRKRKREHLEYEHKNNRNIKNKRIRNRNNNMLNGVDGDNNLKRKRRKKSHSRHNKSDHLVSSLMSEILENTRKPYNGMDSDNDNHNNNKRNQFQSKNKINRRHNPFSVRNRSVSP
mmetsp:Transcript_51570/g.46330  ORF Transcript_51570/g.46330 Transcript_51570/m.46330 type:complete len:206 (-) Transcript_51570:744-1361(-)